MAAVLAFGVTLLVAVLVSGLAHRSILSTAVLFLGAGVLLGPAGAGVLSADARQPIVQQLAVLALFSVLFTDALQVGAPELVRAWRLPGRALLVGLPLTLGLTATLARVVGGLPWSESLLVGAVLSPTDPVFAAAIVGREEVPHRLRHLLNVESGLNDGLALPVVVVLVATVGRRHVDVAHLLSELAFGVALGVAIPAVAIALERTRWFGATSQYEPLNAFAIGIAVLGATAVTGANTFLGAFAAGITIATMSPAVRDSYHQFGELVTEALKLAAVLVFGALVTPAMLRQVSFRGYLFGAGALFVARPVALALALIRSRLGWRERAVAAWFGPKGFASVVYGLLVLQNGTHRAEDLFALIAVVVAASIVAHSSTDVLVAHWFARRAARPGDDATQPGPAQDASEGHEP